MPLQSIDFGTLQPNDGDTLFEAFTKVNSNTVQTQAAIDLISNLVPYTGATLNIDLGTKTITATSIIKLGGNSSQFLKADGSIDETSYALDSNVVHLTGAETILDQKTFNGTLNTTTSIFNLAAVDNSPTAGVPDAIRSYVKGHNGTSNSLTSCFYGLIENNKNAGIWIENLSTAPDATNSIGFRSSFKSTSTGNNFFVGSRGATTAFRVNDYGDIYGAKIILGTTVDNTIDTLQVNGSARIVNLDPTGTGGITTKLLSYSADPYGLVFRAYSTGEHSIQNQKESSDTTLFPLLLQPLGGSLGIGTDTINFNSKLEIKGSASPTNSLMVTTNTFTANSAGSVLRIGHEATLGNTSARIENLINGGTAFGNLGLQVGGGFVGVGIAIPTEKLHVNGYSIATGYKIPSGLPSWFLKADGTYDTNTYALDSTVVHKTGNETITGTKTFNKVGTDTSIEAFNTAGGYSVYLENNSLMGISLFANNLSTGTGIDVGNSSTGIGISSTNSVNGIGIFSDNYGLGKGISSNNTSTGISIYSSTVFGDGIVSNSTGAGLVFVGKNNGVNTLTINKEGNITANSATFASSITANANSTINGNAGSDVLYLQKSTGASLSLSGATGTTNKIIISASNSTNPDMVIYAGGSDRMRLTASGTVGIGTSVLGAVSFGSTPILTVADISGGVLDLRNSSLATTAGNTVGRLQFSVKDDATVAYANAFIDVLALGSAGGNSGGGSIMRFATAQNTVSVSPTERMRITPAGNVLIGSTVDFSEAKMQVTGSSLVMGSFFRNQAAPSTASSGATITGVMLLAGLIENTGVGWTLPTGANIDLAFFPSQSATTSPVRGSFDWSMINTNTAASTLSVATGHTFVGNLTVAASSSARYRTVKTGIATYVTYRLS